MRKLLVLASALAVAGLAGCTTTERYVGGGTALGALGGAAIGAGIGGDSEGALLGGALGAGAGALVGAALDPRREQIVVYDTYEPQYVRPSGIYRDPYQRPHYRPAPAPVYAEQCSYRDSYGQRYIADCPGGY